MSFADWTYVSGGGLAVETWESVSPIQGTHSYSVNSTTNTDSPFIVGYGAGVSSECGRMRALNKQTGGDNGVQIWGVFANVQGSLDILSPAYACVYYRPTNSLYLYKNTLDQVLLASGGGRLASAVWSGATQTEGTVYAIELNWQRVPSSSNIVLIGSMAGPIADPDTYDYSTLTSMATYTDNSGTYLSGVTSGFLGVNGGVNFGVSPCRRYYDVVQMYTD